MLTFASRFALARRFLSHTMTCKGGAVAVSCHKAQGAVKVCLFLSVYTQSDRCQQADLATTCCSVALPACCTAAVSSGVGLDCPELKCCSSKLICAWLGFHLGLYAIHLLSEPDQFASRNSDSQTALLTLVLLPNAGLAVGTGPASCECREEQMSR